MARILKAVSVIGPTLDGTSEADLATVILLCAVYH
jgi:hypothetical protein